MIFKGSTDTLNRAMKKMETMITGRKFAQGMCAAAAVGVITGILIGHKSRKRIQEDSKNKTYNAAVTIEVHDLKRLLIERTE